MEKIKRYVVFLIGMFIIALGVGFVTKAELGTSPVSSTPFVLNRIFGSHSILGMELTFGFFTALFCIFLVIIQLIILKKDFKLEHLLQVPLSIVFGYFVDFAMKIVPLENPQNYFQCLMFLAVGCVVLGAGIYTEVLADVAMLPGESLVRAIVYKTKANFGTIKIACDVSFCATAALISLIFTHRVDGVREGTLVAAVFVGFVTRILTKKLSFLPEKLFGKSS